MLYFTLRLVPGYLIIVKQYFVLKKIEYVKGMASLNHMNV